MEQKQRWVNFLFMMLVLIIGSEVGPHYISERWLRFGVTLVIEIIVVIIFYKLSDKWFDR